MKDKNKIMEEVEKTLRSYDEDAVLGENPFLITRINAAMEKQAGADKPVHSHKPAFSRLIIIMIILVNLITLAYNYDRSSKEKQRSRLIMELKTDFQIDQSDNNF
ncbi:MAG: hypothetical protein ACM3Q2_16800 [Syntrophothermus sp.]